MSDDSNRVSRSLLVIGASLIILVNVAHAYLDPGTGSYIIQILIGGLLGGVFAIGIFWKRFIAAVRRFFTRTKDDKTQGNDQASMTNDQQVTKHEDPKE